MKKIWNLKDIKERELESVVKREDSSVSVTLGDKIYHFSLLAQSDGHMVLQGEYKRFQVRHGDKMMSYKTRDIALAPAQSGRKKSAGADHGGLISPMPGKIFKVLVSVGDEVKKGEPLLILEAMKMEHSIKAPHDGVVKSIDYKEGDQVDGGVELACLDEIKKG